MEEKDETDDFSEDFPWKHIFQNVSSARKKPFKRFSKLAEREGLNYLVWNVD